jgi:pimeloyl-ACP methyl ester carboxylesterase
MGMYGDKDNIVSPRQWKPLFEGVKQNRTERFPKAGHFIMLDESEPFMHKLKSFLDEETPTV